MGSMGLKEFKERIMTDEAYAKKYIDISSPEDLVEIASEDGYTFTVDDVKNNTELTDAELEAAAGGRSIMAKAYFVTSNSIFAKTYFSTR